MMGCSTYICFRQPARLSSALPQPLVYDSKALMGTSHDFLVRECDAFRGLCGCSGDSANEEEVREV